MNSNKKLHNKTRHAFLLTFFPPDEKYCEKEINGFILIKQYNSSNQEWEVAIYTKESYQKKANYLYSKKEFQSSLLNNDLF